MKISHFRHKHTDTYSSVSLAFLTLEGGWSVGTVLSWLTARDCNNITPPLTILDKVVKLMKGASDHLVDPSGSRSSRLPSPFDTTLLIFSPRSLHLVLQCVQNISSSGFGHEIVNAFLVVSPPGRWCSGGWLIPHFKANIVFYSYTAIFYSNKSEKVRLK